MSGFCCFVHVKLILNSTEFKACG